MNHPPPVAEDAMANIGRMVKEALLEEITNELSKRPNFFITTINRLPAAEANTFRQKLFGSRSSLLMINRRLGRRATSSLSLDGLQELLEGSVGLVLSGDDVLSTAKLIMEFRKTHEEQISVSGAVIDGQLLNRHGVEQLANLPPRPVLLAEVVVTIESPMADVIMTVERLLGEIAWLAEQAAARQPAAGSAEPPAPQEDAATPTPEASAPQESSPPATPEAGPGP